MKLLKAVRLDDSDERILGAEGGAAQDGDWLVSGGYAVCDLAEGHRIPQCHCRTTFITVGSFRRCTIAEIVEIDAVTYERLTDVLAQHFVEALGAPSLAAARSSAEDEMSYTADLAAGFPDALWITVRRDVTADGLGERYSVYKRLMIGAHKL